MSFSSDVSPQPLMNRRLTTSRVFNNDQKKQKADDNNTYN
jgi:hypothetical protein